MSETNFRTFWETIKKNCEETGYPIPDEDMATLEHMSGVSAEDFLRAYKEGVDAEGGNE